MRVDGVLQQFSNAAVLELVLDVSSYDSTIRTEMGEEETGDDVKSAKGSPTLRARGIENSR